MAGHLGCAVVGRGTPIGMSDAAPERPAVSARPARSRAWEELAAARAWPAAAPAFTALAHHRDGTLLRVTVDPNALLAYRNLAVDSPMPDGARVVAWREAPDGALLGGYLLEKRGSVWSAQEIDAEGGFVDGDHTTCTRCHDMAPTDHLFRPGASSPLIPGLGESIGPPPR